MSRQPFPGYPVFLDQAARMIGHPESAIPARRNATLAAMANLCSQAVTSDPAAVPAILAKAEEFRDQLHAAYRAAELILADLRANPASPPAAGPVPPRPSEHLPRREHSSR